MIHRDGTGVSGDYFTDTVQLGSATVQNFTMGLALNTTNGPKVNNSGQGLLGVAYPSGETGFLQTGFEFPTIYEAMVSQGLIARSAYSLYLDDREIGKGAVLFGGVDSSKYTGDLTVLPLQPNVLKGGVVDAFIVGLTDVFYEEGLDKTSLTGPGYQGEPADLDSGTTQAYIPDEAYNNLVQGLGAYISPDTGNTLLPCDMPTGNASLSFQFGGNEGIEMAVPLSTLLIQDQDAMEQLPDGTNGCQLGVLPASDIGGGVILGDAFLRSFYVVYDVANDQVAIATAALNATATGSVTPIPTGTSIPGASSTATLILPTVQSNNSGSTSTPSAITSVTGSATFTDLPTAAAVVTSATGTKGSSASASASAIPSGSSSGATNVDVRGFGGLVVFLMTLSALLSF